jgi:lipoprotein-releasing system ATP-binding protein
MTELAVVDVAKQFPTPTAPLVVLRDISLSIAEGQSLAIVGPSGSGKTTLLSILGTLDRPSSGSVQLDGQDPFQLPEASLAEFRNQRIGFVFQDHHLLPQCSALENVLLPTIASGPATGAAIERARELLTRMGLGDRFGHRPAALSGGERQRVAIARALIQEPQLVLADEPTGNLDQTTAGVIGELLLELPRQRPLILIVVTHSQALAATLERRMVLDDGRLREE